jgi:hypothetical protein
MQKIPAYQGLQLGTVSRGLVSVGKEVYNLHAQEFYGHGKRHLNYEALYVCLEELREQLAISGIDTLGVPYNMGCDRAGGNWNVVEAMINAVFQDTDISVFAIKLP